MLTFTPPRIKHINDVLPYIEDKPEIVVMYRDDYTIIDYVYAGNHTFDNAYATECRGLKFDTSGNLLARPYAKFKNINEAEEYLEYNIDFSRPHVLLDKLDGSMVHSIMLNDRLRLMTRKGLSEVALKAEGWLGRNSSSYDLLFAGQYPVSEYTHIFEYVAPHNQIVVFYEEESLILTGIRHIETGEYVRYSEMVSEANRCMVPVVLPYALSLVLEDVRADPHKEGLVIRFEDGAMVKVKADIYCAKHGAVDSVSHCHGVLELTFANLLDDVLPNLAGEFKQRVIDYRDAFFAALEVAKLKLIREANEHMHLDQKEYAMAIKDHPWRGHMFAYRKSANAEQVLRSYIERTSFKGKKVQEVCRELDLPYEENLGRW